MGLFVSTSPSSEEMTLEEEIIHLSDGLNEFVSINAFICASMTSVMSSDDPVPEDVLQGARICSDAIRSRAQEIQVAMDQFRGRYFEFESRSKSKSEQSINN